MSVLHLPTQPTRSSSHTPPVRFPVSGRLDKNQGKGKRTTKQKQKDKDKEQETLKKLHAWAEARPDPEPELTIEHIDFNVAKDAYNQFLEESGLKVRFNWSGLEEVAIFKMTGGDPIHELPGAWLALQSPGMSDDLQAVARCGLPVVYPKGTPSLTLDGNGNGGKDGLQPAFWKVVAANHSGKRITKPSTYQPDLALYLQYRQEAEGRVINASLMPRVVLETAHSQSMNKVLNKSCEILHDAPDLGIHAVIICKLRHLKKSPGPFEAKISVWVRLPTTRSKHDYPVERCRLAGSTQHRSITPPASQEGDGTAGIASSEAEIEVYYHELDKKQDYGILNRSGWKYICNEEDRSQEVESLDMNFYDFVRLCDNDTSLLPPQQQTIQLSLVPLKYQLEAEVDVIRGQLALQAPSNEDRPYPADSTLAGYMRKAVAWVKNKSTR
ncbi:hypothetical protein FRC11_012390 [Ceratobasidium sp. 423]|nr:hypothetical protein FRC11_012390 [Ceratobasidium sp. 423]